MSSTPKTPLGKWDVVSRRPVSLWHRISPSQMLTGSFLMLILLGTSGFRWLPGLYTDQRLGWTDALFTATSAVCITGLIVVDTATYFTFAGQLYILLLIQLGGLGILTFTSLIIIALGRRMSLRQEVLYTGARDIAPTVNPFRLLRSVVLFTFIFEAIGALLLYVFWAPRLGWREAVWPSIFHSISAFCNAGFSTFSDSLTGSREMPGILLVVTALIFIGGISFLTIEEIYLRYRAGRQKRIFRLSLHSRIVLSASLFLLIVGWGLYLLFEWTRSFGGMPDWTKVLNALFMSASGRTAGFNTIDHGSAADSTNFLTVILMMIGGSPGSLTGGVKVTTVALIGLYAWSRLRGEESITVWGRTVPAETTQRAVTLFVVAFGLVTLAIFILTTTEHGRQAGTDFLHYMFEAASALGTNGLSMGVTGGLSTPGKWLAIILMFVGRVGPLTFAAALTIRRPVRRRKFRYAQEDVVIG